jgi:hypothetical protein
VVVIERPDTPVMYLEVADDPVEIRRGWTQLEASVGSLRGRRFLGTFSAGRYRACAKLRANDAPELLGLRSAVVPGGRYLRARLRGEPPELYDRIPAAFSQLEAAATRDGDRPGIEFYRRHDEVDLLMPVVAR